MAQDIPYPLECRSDAPAWTLTLFSNGALYSRLGQTRDFSIAHETAADPGPWPHALTLLSDRDTAIVLLRPDGDAFSVDLLTQDRSLPVLFTATCHHSPAPQVVE